MASPAKGFFFSSASLENVRSEIDSAKSVPAADLVLSLYDRERVPLLRYLSALGVQPDAAEDLLQEAFLKLHEHLLGNGDRSHLRAWLYRVTHNAAQNRRSSVFYSRKAPLDMELVHGEVSPEQRVLQSEQQQRLREGIDELTPAQRQCLVLRAQGFKYREIGEVLQLSTSTVAENVQRAIASLKNDHQHQGGAR